MDVWEFGNTKPDQYQICPKKYGVPFYVYCDRGWTVRFTSFSNNQDVSKFFFQIMQSRSSPDVNFTRTLEDYKWGFGNIPDDLWLGLEKIHLLTNFEVGR